MQRMKTTINRRTMQTPIKVLAIADMAGGVAISTVRAIWPLSGLNLRQQHDFNCAAIGLPDVAAALSGGERRKLEGYDLYVIVRGRGKIEKGFDPFEEFKGAGKVIYDTDDDLTDTHRDFGRGDWFINSVNYADMVTVTNDRLAGVIREHVDEAKTSIRVLPNLLHTDFYRDVSSKAERMIDGLTIGFLGTKTHFFDWYQSWEGVKQVLAEHPEVTLVFGGYRPEYAKEVPNNVFFAPMNIQKYPEMVRQLDIRICPLEPAEEEPFNLSKSPISALEAMAAARPVGKRMGGAVAVVSDHPVFQEDIRHRINGYVVKDGDWYSALKTLITNRKLRESMAVQGYRWVRANADAIRCTERRAKLYHDLVGR